MSDTGAGTEAEVPPPAESPVPNISPPARTPTMEIPVVRGDLNTWFNKMVGTISLAMLAAVAIGAITAYKSALADTRTYAQEKIDSDVKPLANKHDDLRRELERYEDATDAFKKEQREENAAVKRHLTEVQLDIRALSKQLDTGQKPARLNKAPENEP